MLYPLCRWLARIALHWFYRQVEVVGLDRIPRCGPVLLAVSHPNAAVDALTMLAVTERRLTLTAKATLFDHWVPRWFLHQLGAVPLRRASDELRSSGSPRIDHARNAASFDTIVSALRSGGAVLIFPEGRSHSEPGLTALKTGLARIAIQARDDQHVQGIRIVPVGLLFERKWQPRSRILVEVGEPLLLDTWHAPPGVPSVEALTQEVGRRLHDATMNFATLEEAATVLDAAHLIAQSFAPSHLPGDEGVPFAQELALARRIDAQRRVAARDAPERLREFRARLDAFRTEIARLHIQPDAVDISLTTVTGVRFALHEMALAVGLGLIALWGRVHHIVPLTLARWAARRASRTPDEPAMHTIGIALMLVLLTYAAIAAVVWSFAGPLWATAYVLTLPPAGLWDQRYRDRLGRAALLVRAYVTFRRNHSTHDRLTRELLWIRQEARVLDALGDTNEVSAGDALRAGPSAMRHA